MSNAFKWHAYKRPDVSLQNILCVGVYVVPEDMPLHVGWETQCSSLLSSVCSFHEKELPSSNARWHLTGPLRLKFSVNKYKDDTDGFYGQARAAVLSAAAKAGGLKSAKISFPTEALESTVPSELTPPLPIAVPTHAPVPTLAPVPDTPIASTASVPTAKYDIKPSETHFLSTLPDSTWPTHIVFVVFSDFGVERAYLPASSAGLRGAASGGAQPLEKYYIWKAAKAQGVSLDDITYTGGSCSSFSGRAELNEFVACVSTKQGDDLKRRVGFGVGLVTQEAWYHPEVLGSDAVVYHEGLGHALNLPHPINKEPMCVMSHGQYQQLPLDKLNICEEVKAGMRSSEFSNTAFVVNVAAGVGREGYNAAIVERRLGIIAANAGARWGGAPTASSDGDSPHFLSVLWAPKVTSECDAIVFPRKLPLALSADGSTSPAPTCFNCRVPATAGAPAEDVVKELSGAGPFTAAFLFKLFGFAEPPTSLVDASPCPEEQYVIAGADDGAGASARTLNVFKTGKYKWTEVKPSTEPTLASASSLCLSAACPACRTAWHERISTPAAEGRSAGAFLWDKTRNFAVVIADKASFISTSGPLGQYYRFHDGNWHAKPVVSER